ncbi:hypothetical protein SLS62_011001 [Diatrype stigma]|uniref:Uncharacterized protein n=1 Tax=Diatrype stigma TaxID=117547 RepID=A0AAN9U8D3_9PEZI
MVAFKKLAVLVTTLIPAIAAAPFADTSSVGKYIVTLKRGLSDSDYDEHMQYTRDVHSRSLARRGKSHHTWDEGVRHSFSVSDYKSYSARFDHATVEEIRSHGAVASVETSKKFHTWEKIVQPLAPWGLGAISLEDSEAPMETYFYDSAAGAGTYAYVLDSGVRTSHHEFEGRAVMGKSFVANETDQDLNGHGTHVAGTIAGRTFGVAKKTKIIGVKVLDKDGEGESEDILRGMQWVYDDAKKHNRTTTSVINMSLGSQEPVQAEDDMVKALREEGILVVAAAGNDDQNALAGSPGRSPYAITVGAIAVNNTRASFSNWGKTVDIFAPGNQILSAGYLSDTAFEYKSGTSQATPHVAGLIVYLKSLYGLTHPDQVVKKLHELGLKNVVKDPKGSANLLAFNGQAPAAKAS